MDRDVQKNAVVNLLTALAVFIAALVVTVYAGSLSGEATAGFLGLVALIAFASWFQMRLEENERLEKLEVEEMARAKGEAALFDSKESELFPARRPCYCTSSSYCCFTSSSTCKAPRARSEVDAVSR